MPRGIIGQRTELRRARQEWATFWSWLERTAGDVPVAGSLEEERRGATTLFDRPYPWFKFCIQAE